MTTNATKVLFVDDEDRVLSGLRRMLRPYRTDWAMTFVASGSAALEEMAREPYDVVVSDVRMPGMDGIELLGAVAERHPDVIRIILSGHANEDATRKATGVAHQYLAKPCSAEQLRETVQRSASIRATLSDPNLIRAVAATTTLPSAPTLYNDLTAELRSADPSLRRVGDIVARDLAMTAKLMQMVNSAFFGLRRRVTDVHQAVTLLGTETIAALSLSAHVFQSAKIPPNLIGHVDTVWSHSVSVGTIAKALMTRSGAEPADADEAFLAGILHDAGKLVLVTNFAEDYARIVETGGDVFAERARFGADHAVIGAHLLSLWGLPDTIVEAVAFHHSPMASPVRGLSPLAVVHAASALEERATADAAPPWDLAFFEEAGLTGSLPSWVQIADDLEARRDDT